MTTDKIVSDKACLEVIEEIMSCSETGFDNDIKYELEGYFSDNYIEERFVTKTLPKKEKLIKLLLQSKVVKVNLHKWADGFVADLITAFSEAEDEYKDYLEEEKQRKEEEEEMLREDEELEKEEAKRKAIKDKAKNKLISTLSAEQRKALQDAFDIAI